MKLHLLAAAWFVVVLPAQTAVPVANPPHVLIDTVGPDGWRTRLGPTNLGSLLESEQGRKAWQPRMLPVLALWQKIVGDDATFKATEGRMLGYGGRVRLGVWVHAEALERQGIQRLVLVLEGDGRTDLAALAADVRAMQKTLPGEWALQTFGDDKVEVLQHEADAMIAPTVVGGNVVVLMTDASDLAVAFREARTWATSSAITPAGKPPAPTSPALRLDVDVAAMVALAKAAGDDDDSKMMTTLGLGSLGRMQMTIATAGPHVQVELAQHFTPTPRGLFAAFFPPVQGVPALQRAAPKGEGSWRVGHFDFQALFDTVLAAATAMLNPDNTEVRQEMKQELGIDVGDDLIAHMTTEVLVVGAPLAGLDRPDDFTWTIAVRLRDEKAFAKGLDTLLQHSKPALSREATTTIDGIECHRYGNMLGYDLWFAVGRGTFLFAGGRDAEEQLTTSIAALAPALAAATTPDAAAAAFVDLARFLPAGHNGQARGDLDSLFAVPTEWWSMLLRELLPFAGGEPDDDPEARERARELLQKHNLGTVRTATGYADSVWRWRLFW